MRGLPAKVMSATLHLPVAMAWAAWEICAIYDAPPSSVESIWRTFRPI